MKTKQILCMLTLTMGALLVNGCGGSSQPVVIAQPTPQSNNPFGELYDDPTFEPDTEEYYTGSNSATGSSMRRDVVRKMALTNAQNIARQKIKHAYKGMISDYSGYIGNNLGTNAEILLESAGDQKIDAIVNDTKETLVKWSAIDDKGNITCYVGIRIDKTKLANAVADCISETDELKIRVDAGKFREYMHSQFRDSKPSSSNSKQK